jgi:hypothetical protein
MLSVNIMVIKMTAGVLFEVITLTRNGKVKSDTVFGILLGIMFRYLIQTHIYSM